MLKNKIKNENIDIQTRTTELPAAQKLRNIIKQNNGSQSTDTNETEAHTIMRKSGRIAPVKSEANVISTEKSQTISPTEFDKFGRIKNRSYGE